MKKSELIARYRHFGEELVALNNSKEFFDELHSHTVTPVCDNIDTSSSSMRFSVDGWDYYVYSSCFKVGWNGDVDSDSFYFKIRVCTAEERESIKAIFSRENDYTVFEDVALGGEDFRFDTPDLIAL